MPAFLFDIYPNTGNILHIAHFQLNKEKMMKETKKQALKRKLSEKALKPGAISEFLKWQEKHLDIIDAEAERIQDLLLASAPPAISAFLSNRSYMIYGLFNEGEQSTTATFNDLRNIYSLSRTKFMKSIRMLRKAWMNIVKITMKESKPQSEYGYFTIVFSVVQPKKEER